MEVTTSQQPFEETHIRHRVGGEAMDRTLQILDLEFSLVNPNGGLATASRHDYRLIRHAAAPRLVRNQKLHSRTFDLGCERRIPEPTWLFIR